MLMLKYSVKSNKYLEKYLEYLKYQKNYSDYTVVSYCNDIVEYLEYLETEALDFKIVDIVILDFI